MNIARKLFVLASLGLVMSGAYADDTPAYPSRQVTLIVPFSPGGGTDTTSRFLAQKLGEIWKQSVVIENKPGASGMIGAGFVARAKPDGYTLMMGNIGTQSINPSLYKMPYDSKTAFEPITEVAELPLILVVNPKENIKSVKDLIDTAKKEPGKLFFSSSGAGSSMQLAAEVFQKDAQIKMTHVPFAGEGPAITNLLGGQVNVTFGTILGSGPFVKQQRLLALGVTSSKRYPAFPDVPTIAESGLDGYNSVSWVGLLAPKGTPRVVIDKISKDVQTVLENPEVKQKLINQGALPVGSTPAEFSEKIASDYALYNKIIKDNKITVQ
ncbi:Bug family tripartite tricarboxylate transporter substrate binding protein [Paralcaligenes ginsengisoli]